MKVTLISQYRDCSTGSIITIQDDGSKLEYLVHSHNWGNDRIDITKGGFKKQLPVNRDEILELVEATREYVQMRFKEFSSISRYDLANFYSLMVAFMVALGDIPKKINNPSNETESMISDVV